ncbi:MAG: sensor histidine kinase [Chitinophagaceae bacterium]
MPLEQDVFLHGTILVIILGVIIACYIFFHNSKDRVYVSFIIYVLLETPQLMPALESMLFSDNGLGRSQGLLKYLFTARAFIWFTLGYQLLDNPKKILKISWCAIAGLLFLQVALQPFFRSVIQLIRESILINSLNFLFIAITIGILAMSTARKPWRWKYYVACFFFMLAINIYGIIAELIPSLLFNGFYPFFILFKVPLGFTIIISRYSNFLHVKMRALHPLHKPNIRISEQIIKSQEQERERIARDLHDQLGGTLATIKMQMQGYAFKDSRMEQTVALIDKASEDVRNIAHDLMPKDFESTDLHTILHGLVGRLNSQGSMQFTFIHTNVVLPLPKQFELVLFRIILELVTNVVKHSAATEAVVQLVYHENNLDLVVEDNGRGFDTEITPGLGLKNIRSRSAYLKGKVHIDSGSKGTIVIIGLPYE